jgi:O-antigen/teichoic acid export membrane protein
MFKKNKTIILLLFLGIFSYLIRYFFNAIISQYLTPEYYGDFAITIRSVAIISLVLLLGTNISSVKYLSTYFDSNNSANINHFLKWNLKLVFKTFLASFVCFILFYSLLIVIHQINLKNFASYHYSLYALWLAPFSALYILLASYLLSYKWNNLALFFNKIAMNALLVLFLFVTVFFLNISIQFYHILLFLFITFCVIIAVELYLVNRVLLRHNIKLTKDDIKIDPKTKREWLFDSFRLTSVQLIFNLVCFADLLIIELIHPNEHATGYYAAMLVIGNILWVVPSSVTSFMAPRITPLIEKEKYTELQDVINTTNYVNLPILIITLLVMIIFADFFLSLFGASYSQVQIPLIILCVGYFFGAISLSNARILIFLDSKKILFINILELVILILVSIVLTYLWGILGMSIAVLLSAAIKAIIMYRICKKSLPINPFTFM